MALFADKIQETKNYSQSENAFFPRKILIPLSEEYNGMCEAVVSQGDVIEEGQVIAKGINDSYVQLHSSIPGVVSKITNCCTPNGRKENVIEINLNGSFNFSGKILKKKKFEDISPDSAKRIIKTNGIINTFNVRKPVNLFSQVNNPEAKSVIVRLVDEDPTCFTDSLISKFYLDQIITGAKIAAKAIDAAQIVLIITSGFEARDLIIEKYSKDFTILELKNNDYPQLLKKHILETFNKTNKHNKIKITENDVFADPSTLYDLYKAAIFGIPVISKLVHFSGNCLISSCLLEVKTGSTIGDILSQIGGLSKEPKQIIINGNIRGMNVSSLEIPVTKYVKSVSVISHKKKTDSDVYDCIDCGSCRIVCKEKVLPDILFNNSKNFNQPDEEQIYMISNCIDCSSCNMVCPSRLPLSQMINALKNKYCKKD